MAFFKSLGLVCLNILSAYSNLVPERFDIFNVQHQKVLAVLNMEHGQDDVISVIDRTSNEILHINKDFIACDPGINQKLYQKFENQRNDLSIEDFEICLPLDSNSSEYNKKRLHFDRLRGVFSFVSRNHSTTYSPHYHIVNGYTLTNQAKIMFKTKEFTRDPSFRNSNAIHILINRHHRTNFLGHRDIDYQEDEDMEKAEFELRFKQG